MCFPQLEQYHNISEEKMKTRIEKELNVYFTKKRTISEFLGKLSELQSRNMNGFASTLQAAKYITNSKLKKGDEAKINTAIVDKLDELALDATSIIDVVYKLVISIITSSDDMLQTWNESDEKKEGMPFDQFILGLGIDGKAL